MRVFATEGAENAACALAAESRDYRDAADASGAELILFGGGPQEKLVALLESASDRAGCVVLEARGDAGPGVPARAKAAFDAGGVAATLRTDTAYGAPIAEILCRRMSERGVFDADTRGKAELALHETISNAVLHGNLGFEDDWRMGAAAFRRRGEALRDGLADESRAGRLIVVAAFWTDDRATFTVTDQGPGYDLERFADPAKRPNRGLGIVAALTHGLTLEDEGRTVSIGFQR